MRRAGEPEETLSFPFGGRAHPSGKFARPVPFTRLSDSPTSWMAKVRVNKQGRLSPLIECYRQVKRGDRLPLIGVELVINNTEAGGGAVEHTEVKRVRKASAIAEEGRSGSANPCVAANQTGSDGGDCRNISMRRRDWLTLRHWRLSHSLAIRFGDQLHRFRETTAGRPQRRD